jgi:hypothetical protein
VTSEPVPQPQPGPAPGPPGDDGPPSDSSGTSSAAPPETDPASTLRSMGAAAAQPGSTDERLDTERDARDSFRGSRVQADRVYGGSHYEFVLSTTGSPGRPAAAPVSAEEKSQAGHAFVRPPGFASLQQDAAARRLTLLRGAPGTGKAALALALVLSNNAERPVFWLDPATDLSQLQGDDLSKGSAYLFEDLTESGARALAAFQLRRLEQELTRRDCVLIITAASGITLADQAMTRAVIELRDSADPCEVARAHLAWRIGPALGERAQRLLARPEIEALITQKCGSGQGLATAAQLGRMLAEAGGPEESVAQQVTGRMALREADAFGDWFDGLPDLDTQCLGLAIAVFGGEAYETVAALASLLQERLQLPESPENPEHPRSAPLTATRRTRLRLLHATLTPGRVSTRHGGAPPGLEVRFREPGFPARVLMYVWDEFDAARTELTDWLHACARHDLATVRVRAAVAVGVLAARSFDVMRSQVIAPWAAERNYQFREAAALALHAAIDADRRLSESIRNLVRAWTLESQGPQLRASAARAWRTVTDEDGSAPELLYSLADTDSAPVVNAICDSVAEYLTLDEKNGYQSAIALLLRLVSATEPCRREVGERAFLYAAADLRIWEPDRGLDPGAPQGTQAGSPAGPGDQGVSWPALLSIAARDPVRQHEIAELWKTAVCSPEVHEAAHAVLAEWALLVEEVPTARRALGRLLAAAAGTPRSARILRYQANTWTTARDGAQTAPNTASDVLAYINERHAQ